MFKKILSTESGSAMLLVITTIGGTIILTASTMFWNAEKRTEFVLKQVSNTVEYQKLLNEAQKQAGLIEKRIQAESLEGKPENEYSAALSEISQDFSCNSSGSLSINSSTDSTIQLKCKLTEGASPAQKNFLIAAEKDGFISDGLMAKVVLENTAAPALSPDIEVVFNGSTPIVPGNTYTIGTAAKDAPQPPASFSIENTGSLDLVLSGLTLTGPFSHDIPPGDFPITLTQGQTRVFNLTYSTSTGGVFTGNLSIANNLGAGPKSPFAFDVRAVIENPRIEVSHGGTPIAHGGNFSFGPYPGGTPPLDSQQTFTIKNIGQQTLTLGAISVPPGIELWTPPSNSNLGPDETTTFTVYAANPSSGPLSGLIGIPNNDNGTHEFTIQLLGAQPNLQVFYRMVLPSPGAWIPIASNTTLFFPPINEGEASPVFEVRLNNFGIGDLNVGSISLSPSNMELQNLPSLPAPIPFNGSETFQLRITDTTIPYAGAAPMATISIQHDDLAKDRPYLIPVQANITDLSPQVNVTGTRGGNFPPQCDPTSGASETITVRNSGNGNLRITNIALPGFVQLTSVTNPGGGSSPSFSFPIDIPPSQFMSFVYFIDFPNMPGGAFNDDIIIYSNDPTWPIFRNTIRGNLTFTGKYEVFPAHPYTITKSGSVWSLDYPGSPFPIGAPQPDGIGFRIFNTGKASSNLFINVSGTGKTKYWAGGWEVNGAVRTNLPNATIPGGTDRLYGIGYYVQGVPTNQNKTYVFRIRGTNCNPAHYEDFQIRIRAQEQ